MEGSQPTRVSEEGWLTDFSLTSSQKEKVTNATLLGKPYVVSFFYSTCPSVCVRQNEKKKTLYDKFADKGIRFVSVSVDPEIDTPERLAEYADRFQADPAKWLFLTGDMDYISRVGAEVFRIFVTRRGHPEQFIIVDAEGKIFGYYNWTDAEHFLALQQDLESLAADPALRANEVPRGREKKPVDVEDEESEENSESVSPTADSDKPK
jgi:protein SCO1/2